jgi:hypothetical protein
MNVSGEGVTANKSVAPFTFQMVYELRGQKDWNSTLTFRFYTNSLRLGQYRFDTSVRYQMTELKLFGNSAYKRYDLNFERGEVMPLT